jgi:hypothetical protein
VTRGGRPTQGRPVSVVRRAVGAQGGVELGGGGQGRPGDGWRWHRATNGGRPTRGVPAAVVV